MELNRREHACMPCVCVYMSGYVFHDKIAWIKIHFCGYDEIKWFVTGERSRTLFLYETGLRCICGNDFSRQEIKCAFRDFWIRTNFMEYYKNWCLLLNLLLPFMLVKACKSSDKNHALICALHCNCYGMNHIKSCCLSSFLRRMCCCNSLSLIYFPCTLKKIKQFIAKSVRFALVFFY